MSRFFKEVKFWLTISMYVLIFGFLLFGAYWCEHVRFMI